MPKKHTYIDIVFKGPTSAGCISKTASFFSITTCLGHLFGDFVFTLCIVKRKLRELSDEYLLRKKQTVHELGDFTLKVVKS